MITLLHGCIQDGGVALWNAITDVAGDRHALLLASRTRQRETSTQQLYVPCPWQGDGRAEPATEEREEEGQRWKFYLSPLCLPIHPLLIFSGSQMKYLVFPFNQ